MAEGLDIRVKVHSRTSESEVGPIERALFALFEIRVPRDGDLPVAAVTRIHDNRVGDRDWWIRADPVCLQPHGDGLVLHAGLALDLAPADAEQLATAIREAYAADGWRLETPHPLRWYLQPPHPPTQLETSMLTEVVGRNINRSLPKGRDASAWRTLLTEIQLLLHACPVNERRQRQGLQPINSLWFWGGGRVPEPTASRWSSVCSAEPLGSGLARIAGLVAQPLPQGLDQWFARAGAGRHLVILEDGQDGSSGGGAAQDETLNALEARWFAPAIRALHGGQLDELTLYVNRQAGYCLTGSGLRRWWRRARPLSEFWSARDG